MLIFAVAVYFTWKKRGSLQNWKYERRFRFFLSFVMLMAEMSYFWRLLYVGDEWGHNTLMIKLPLQVCQWGLICCVYMITSGNNSLLGINFFITLGCTAIALFVPQTVISLTCPGYYRYYQFWMEHLLPIYSTLYMMIVHGKRPRYRHLWLSIVCLALLAIPSYFANELIPDVDYLYVKLAIPFMPEGQLPRMMVYFVIIVLLFHGMWLILNTCAPKKKEAAR
ncbi:MAG: YwaF family protein [Clostridia bacterium]|nr:YwaF family protein [Clostridia bacterium]